MNTRLHHLFLAVILFASISSNAQRICGSYEHLQEQLAQDPSFALKQNSIEAFTQDYIARKDKNPNLFRAGAVNIPVVVHVVFNTPAQNISDDQILSQIDVLNKDFQKLNADITKVPGAFASAVADCQIQFCLAKRDPGGNATSGIVRKSTSVISFSTNDAVKKSSTGGDDAWDATKYLNLWVCYLSGGVLGYAQFPGGSPVTDGVVITYTGFGTTGAAKAPFNLGRTATHEIGHWLNLRHIWGDDGTACTGSDLVDDTPNQAGENYGCPAFPLTDRCTRKSPGVMFMNYMDYTDDACMYMFTNGQKARIDAALDGARLSLLSSDGCVSPVPAACGTPSGVTATAITQTSATISWVGFAEATSYTLKYKLSSAATFSSIIVNTGTSYPLAGLTAGSSYTYQVSATCAGGEGNYSTAQSFTTLNPPCTDANEPNNSLSAAAGISLNTNIYSQISSTTDLDYYKITTGAGATNIKITLSNLPADYDVKLYNSAGTLLKTSQNGGTTAETIVYNTANAGTYYIQVYGYNRAYSSTVCYILNAQTGGSVFREVEEQRTIKDIVQVYPIPAHNKINLAYKTSEKGIAEIVITNQLGSFVMKKEISVNEGINNNSLDVSGLVNGMYFIKVQQGKTFNVLKMFIQH